MPLLQDRYAPGDGMGFAGNIDPRRAGLISDHVMTLSSPVIYDGHPGPNTRSVPARAAKPQENKTSWEAYAEREE